MLGRQNQNGVDWEIVEVLRAFLCGNWIEMGSLGWSFFSDEGSEYQQRPWGCDGVGFGSEGPVFESSGVDFSNLNGLVSSCSSPRLEDLIGALQKYLPSNNEDEEGSLPSADAYSCDEFRMYEFKVRRCMRGRSHDWTECPFAHPGEKARRRDPRRFHYSGTACPDFRKGSCRRGDSCEFAHGVFECWLHPARYRTQPCKDGRNCKRRVCFFAHTSEQLRLLPSISSSSQASGGSSRSALALALHASAVKNSLSASYDGSPRRQLLDGLVESSNHGGETPAAHLFSKAVLSSPTSTLVGHTHSPPPLSPPLSPSVSPPDSPDAWLNSMNSLNSISVNSRALKGFQKPSLSPSALSQVHSSPSFAQGSSPRRHHLDRVASMPAITLPSSGSPRLAGPSVPSSPVAQSSKSMMELMNSLQSLELNSWQPAQISANACHGSPRGSNLRHCVTGGGFNADGNNLGEVKANYGEDSAVSYEEPTQRVESGRDLRAKIYGKLNNQSHHEHLPSEASPDLGWVNELVK